jgi:hypothetical protein
MHSLDNLPYLQDAIIDSKSTRVVKSQGARIVDNEGIKLCVSFSVKAQEFLTIPND